MSIWPYTDKEWEELPHVILTADIDQDPSIVDCNQEDKEEWYNAMQDLPTLPTDPLFDDIGDQKYAHQIMEAIMSTDVMETNIVTDICSMGLAGK